MIITKFKDYRVDEGFATVPSDKKPVSVKDEQTYGAGKPGRKDTSTGQDDQQKKANKRDVEKKKKLATAKSSNDENLPNAPEAHQAEREQIT